MTDQPQFKCDFCGMVFSREKTLFAHLCEQKRRRFQKDEKSVKLGFYAYQKFLELNKREKETYDKFCDTRYYTAFIKFGRYIDSIKAINPEEFIIFIIKSGVSIDYWCRDALYFEYMKDYVKQEPAENAIERNLKLMQQWAEQHSNEWQNFFREVNSNLLVDLVKLGRISPWVLYNSESGKDALARMNQEQLSLVHEYADIGFWKTKFQIYPADAEFIRSSLKQAGV